MRVIVSHHMFRRTARAKEQRLEAKHPGNQYRVTKASRGPWRYYVVQVERSNRDQGGNPFPLTAP